MKLWMRIATPAILVMGAGFQANAQYMMQANYGSGMPYQQCPYNQSVGEGASPYIEDIKQARKDLQQAQKDLQQKKRELSKLESRDIKRNQTDIERVISADFTDVLYEHMDNGYACEEYQGSKTPEITMAAGQEGQQQITAQDKEIAKKNKHSFKPYGTNDWYETVCNSDKPGSINSAACGLKSSQEEGINRSQVDACKKGLGEYRKNRNQANKLGREIDNLQARIDGYKDALQTAQENYRDEQRYATEGGGCIGCEEESNSGRVAKPDYLASGISLALGVAAGVAGYSLENHAIDEAAKLGFPSQPGQALYTALGFGAPFIMNGLYGALGGQTGAGAFGCAGIGSGAGGMFGNPYALYGNGLGGGMFLPGMNGMINPYIAANGYMMGNMMGGMMGAMIGGGAFMGGMSGYPMGGMIGGGYPMGAMIGGGYPMGAMVAGGAMIGGGYPMGGMMGGYPMGGMIGGGYPMGAMIGGGGYPMGAMISGGAMIGGGYPMGGMMGGYPMGGGMIGGGYPMGAMVAGGAMIGGGYPMGGMMGGYPMGGGMIGGGYPMGAMIGGGGMMGMMMGDGGMAQMQMYQQMQQMQMQQYQMYMQQQSAKQQAMMGLQSEYQSLLMRMAQVQMGIGIGSVGIGGGLGMGTGIIGSGMGGGTITGPGGSITGPGVINGNGSYLPGGGSSIGPVPVNQGTGLGNSTR